MPRIFLFILCFLSTPLFAENDGILLARQHVPRFLHHVYAYGKVRTEQFFKDWTYKDIVFFTHKNSYFYDSFAPSLQTVGPLDKVVESFVAILGEAYGTAILRARAASSPGLHFMDEYQYQSFNQIGGLPDGLLFRVEHGNLYVVGVLESKTGAKGFCTDQAKRYLQVWKRAEAGLKVEYRNEDNKVIRKRFSPEQIFMINRNGDTVSALSDDFDLNFLVSISTLVSTKQRPDFRGEVLLHPFTKKELVGIATSYAKELAGDRPFGVRPIRRAPPSPGLPRKAQVNRFEPMTDEAFVELIFLWFLKNDRWPRPHGPSDEEKKLANQVRLRGAQGGTFVQLPGWLRHYLTERSLTPEGEKVFPAISPLEMQLRRINPLDESATSTLRAYVRRYEQDATKRTIVAYLKNENPAWETVLDGVELSLYEADPLESRLCAEKLAAYSQTEKLDPN